MWRSIDFGKEKWNEKCLPSKHTISSFKVALIATFFIALYIDFLILKTASRSEAKPKGIKVLPSALL